MPFIYSGPFLQAQTNTSGGAEKLSHVKVKELLVKEPLTNKYLVDLNKVEVTGISEDWRKKLVSQELVYMKNVRREKNLPDDKGDCPAAGEKLIVERGGIIIRVGVSDRVPKIEVTNIMPLNQGNERVELYYYVRAKDVEIEKNVIQLIQGASEKFLETVKGMQIKN